MALLLRPMPHTAPTSPSRSQFRINGYRDERPLLYRALDIHITFEYLVVHLIGYTISLDVKDTRLFGRSICLFESDAALIHESLDPCIVGSRRERDRAFAAHYSSSPLLLLYFPPLHSIQQVYHKVPRLTKPCVISLYWQRQMPDCFSTLKRSGLST